MYCIISNSGHSAHTYIYLKHEKFFQYNVYENSRVHCNVMTEQSSETMNPGPILIHRNTKILLQIAFYNVSQTSTKLHKTSSILLIVKNARNCQHCSKNSSRARRTCVPLEDSTVSLHKLWSNQRRYADASSLLSTYTCIMMRLIKEVQVRGSHQVMMMKVMIIHLIPHQCSS